MEIVVIRVFHTNNESTYVVMFKDDCRKHATGGTIDEALGKLLRYYSTMFNITLNIQT
jgi:predicted RNase H-like HicB family nuclease